MGVIKVIKAIVRRSTEVAEPELEAEMSVFNMITSHIMANVPLPLDGTSSLFCLVMSLSLCFVLALAVVHWSSSQHVGVKEESGEEKESEQKDTPEVGELMCKIIDADTEQDDTEDETVSKDDTKSIDDPPTPTMSPSIDTIDEKEANTTPAPSVPDLSPTPRSSSRRRSLAAKAKSIGGSIRRLKINKSKN